jgi:hypothetical protein
VKREQIEYLDPATPLYVCPECLRPRPSEHELAVHLHSLHSFPIWYAEQTAGKVKPVLPHEVANGTA